MNHEFDKVNQTSEYQRQIFEEICRPQPIVIAAEGGPCGGKTTLINEIKLLSQEQTKNFVLIPEIATAEIGKLLNAGISIENFFSYQPSYLEFQKHILNKIVLNIQDAKEKYAGTNSIIVVDRADIKPYLNEEQYDQILLELGLEQSPLISLVDKVVYLPTVAKISSEVYEALLSTNPSRYESTAQAIDTCNRNLKIASINPEFSIYSSPNFKDKISDALFDIFHHEIEKESKFIPNYPIDINQTLEIIDSSSNEYLNSMDIYQSYHEIAGQKFRLRHGVVDNKHVFYHFALKSGNNGDTRQEIHRNLSKDLYNQLYEINCIKELHKIRSRFIYEFQNKEYILCLDYYDQINKTIVEIEGMGQELAKQVNIKGFSLGSLSTEELVQ